MFFFKFLWTLSWQRPLSYRNQSIHLLCKSMDWFLYDNGIRHECVKMGKNEEKLWAQHILWSSKILFCFWIEAYIFFQMVIFATLIRRCPTLWKSTLKMTTLNVVKFNAEKHNVVSTLLYVVNFNVDIHNVVSTLIWRCATLRRHINLKTTSNRRWNVCWVCSKFTGEHPCRSMISIKLLFATLPKSYFGMGVLL